VAGTKGKGTTCHYCNLLLQEYQRTKEIPLSIGCYTTPHLVEVRERIQINSEPISKELFTKYVKKLWNEMQSLQDRPDLETPSVPGYPGFLTLLAIYIFNLESIDVAIIETGVGGERDSTNVFRNPTVTGITTIDFDHIETLGDNIEDIAWHKAGIFKQGSLAFTVMQGEDRLRVLRKRANKISIQGELQVVTDEIVSDYDITLEPNMPFQRLNASLAISMIDAYLQSVYPDFIMTKSLARSVENAQLPGRCQIKSDKYNTWLLSVAHNKVSLEETVSWFKEIVLRPESVYCLWFTKKESI